MSICDKAQTHAHSAIATAAYLIDSCQISVHITRKATPTRHLLPSSWHLWGPCTCAVIWQRVSDHFSLLFFILPWMLISPACKVHYLSQSLGIRAHVSQNNQDVFLALVRQELCRSQGQTRSDDTLNAMGEQGKKKKFHTCANTNSASNFISRTK